MQSRHLDPLQHLALRSSSQGHAWLSEEKHWAPTGALATPASCTPLVLLQPHQHRYLARWAKINLRRCLEASHTWLSHWLSQLDMPPPRHNDGKTTESPCITPGCLCLWYPYRDSAQRTWFSLLKLRVFRIEVWLLYSRPLLFWHIVCMKTTSHQIFFSILQYYVCF